MRTTATKLAAVVGLSAMLVLSACSGGDGGGDAATNPVTDPSIGIAIDGTGKAVEPTQDTVVIEVFSDFLCPWCQRFEEDHGAELLELAGDDRFDVRWRPVAWLDRNAGGTEYSTRTAMLLLHVAQESPEHFWDAVEGIMAIRETGPSLSHEELAAVVADLGVDGDLVAAQDDDALREQVLAFSNAASALEVAHVPWVNIDGEQWDWSAEDAGSVVDAAHAALS